VNTLIIFQEELKPDGTALLMGERATHAREVHELTVGAKVSAGLLNGLLGKALVTSVTAEQVTLKLDLTQPPPVRRGYTLIVGLSRPQTVKKVLSIAGMCGIDAVYFVNASLGEKSYLQSKALEEKRIEIELIKGLEQARDTIPAKVEICTNFKSFMKDNWSKLEPDPEQAALKILAHTESNASISNTRLLTGQSVIMAIGPEAGWAPEEVLLFKDKGFQAVTLGERILRVEYALVSLISKIDLLADINSAKENPTE